MESSKCSWMSIHLFRFDEPAGAEDLVLPSPPTGAVIWKVGPDSPGPDSPLGVDGLPTGISPVWCIVGLYRDRAFADTVLDMGAMTFASFGKAIESWHCIARPIAHRGELNWLDRKQPGLVFDVNTVDPGGPMLVMTTAGFDLGPNTDMDRIRDWFANVVLARDSVDTMPGLMLRQIFGPIVPEDDGVTLTLWKNDSAMLRFAYQSVLHRKLVDRYKAEHTADRTSFTRFRPVRSSGTWGGVNPVVQAGLPG